LPLARFGLRHGNYNPINWKKRRFSTAVMRQAFKKISREPTHGTGHRLAPKPLILII